MYSIVTLARQHRINRGAAMSPTFGLAKKWTYLSVVLDLYTRKVIGWAISSSPNSQLTKKALRMTFKSRRKPKIIISQ